MQKYDFVEKDLVSMEDSRLSVTLRSRIIFLLILIIVIVTGVLNLFIGNRVSKDVKQEVGFALSENAYQLASRLDQYMWGRTGEIRIVSELSQLKRQDNREEIEKILNEVKKVYPAFSWIGVTDRKGVVIAGTDGLLVGQDISARPVYREGIKGRFTGDVHEAVLLAKLLPNPSGEAMKFVDISMPIKNDRQEIIGVVAAHLGWSWAKQLQESMFEPLKNRNGEEIFIISQIDNAVLVGPDGTVGQQLNLTSIDQARTGMLAWSQEIWPDGKEYITGFAAGTNYLDYQSLGWIVLVRKPTAVAFSIIDKLQSFIWTIGGIISTIFIGLGWWLAGSVTRPLVECARLADKVRFGGRLEIPQHKGIKEIELLTDSLIDLVNTLTTAEHALNTMESMAHHDRLTGLPNRNGLEQYIPKALDGAQGNEHILGFLCLDLDGFKHVNDTKGHAGGDLVLQEVAKRLQNSVRADEFVGRLGGDEFIAILVIDKQPEQTISNVAARIIQAINQPIGIDGDVVTVGCSIGCAFAVHGDDIQKVIDLADKALYDVKRSGKNKYKIIGKAARDA